MESSVCVSVCVLGVGGRKKERQREGERMNSEGLEACNLLSQVKLW